jgi:hypothetical protein
MVPNRSAYQAACCCKASGSAASSGSIRPSPACVLLRPDG